MWTPGTFLLQVRKDGRTSARAPEPGFCPGADFGTFFDLHFDDVFRALLLMSGDRHEAEDVAQEAFVKILERWDHVAGMDDPTGYLYHTALNERRDRLRRVLRWRRRSLYERGDPDATSAAASHGPSPAAGTRRRHTCYVQTNLSVWNSTVVSPFAFTVRCAWNETKAFDPSDPRAWDASREPG
jgi:hypothetical protein